MNKDAIEKVAQARRYASELGKLLGQLAIDKNVTDEECEMCFSAVGTSMQFAIEKIRDENDKPVGADILSMLDL